MDPSCVLATEQGMPHYLSSNVTENFHHHHLSTHKHNQVYVMEEVMSQ